MEIISKNLADTEKFAGEFTGQISGLKKNGATVVGLYGNLGSGKTAFVQCVARILGVKDEITSPTFVIMKSYPLHATSTRTTEVIRSGGRYTQLVHIDAYRLKSGDELRKLKFEELLHDPKNLILVEWADLVADILPTDSLKINFEFINETTRKINFIG